MTRPRKLLSSFVVVLFILGVVATVRIQRAASRHRSSAQSRGTGLAAIAGSEDQVAYLRAPLPALRSVQAIVPKGGMGVAGGVPGGSPRDADKSVIRTASLSLVVNNVADAVEQLRRLTLQQQGEVDESRQSSLSENTREGSLTVRVPSARLDASMKQFESIASRVTNEQFAATDVTRQSTDSTARLRSLVAEEQQYLQILKQAKSVEDVLKVTEKLTDVRTAIEQLQTSISDLQHDVAMSAVAISLTQDAPEAVAFSNWRPLINARRAAHNMLEGLADWADSIVAFVIYLPVTGLWLITICAIAWIGWKIVRFLWLRRKPLIPPTSGQSPAPLR